MFLDDSASGRSEKQMSIAKLLLRDYCFVEYQIDVNIISGYKSLKASP